MQHHDPTINDVLTAINKFSTAVDKRFDGVESRLDEVERDMKGLKGEVSDLRATMTNQYVSKSYLDQKLGEHTEAIISRIDRKFEREKKFKVGVLDILKRNKLASQEEIRTLEQLI